MLREATSSNFLTSLLTDQTLSISGIAKSSETMDLENTTQVARGENLAQSDNTEGAAISYAKKYTGFTNLAYTVLMLRLMAFFRNLTHAQPVHNMTFGNCGVKDTKFPFGTSTTSSERKTALSWIPVAANLSTNLQNLLDEKARPQTHKPILLDSEKAMLRQDIR